MWLYEKKLLYPVRVSQPNPVYANLLMEQLGGQDGEFTAFTTYNRQRFLVDDQMVKEVLVNIATEELGHLEMVGTYIELLGSNPDYRDSAGDRWSAHLAPAVPDVVANLYTDIAAELRAKAAYEKLYLLVEDPLIRDGLDFLAAREEAHARMFRKALEDYCHRYNMQPYNCCLLRDIETTLK